MNIYSEENFNDFAILGKKSFSLKKVSKLEILNDELEDFDKEKKVVVKCKKDSDNKE